MPHQRNANIDASIRKAVAGFNKNRIDQSQDRPAPAPGTPKKQAARSVGSRDKMSGMSDAELDAAIRARKANKK
jgi:hypothetical protein